MSDKREHVRTPFVCRIKIGHETLGEWEVKTRDISDGGVFVSLEPEQMPSLGTVVVGQVQGLADDAPELRMEVVRIESDGVGLRFLD